MQNRTLSLNGHAWQVKIQDEADESVANEIFVVREYRAVEEAIKNARQCVLDVGAHRGFFTLYARALNPTVPIVAVEPEPHNIHAFEQHMRLNNIALVSLVPAAVAGTSGSRALLVAEDSHNHELARVSGVAGGSTMRVAAKSLADIIAEHHIESIDVLKMDIEGGEYEIIDTVDEDVWSKIRLVVMEYHTISGRKVSELERGLRERGFGVQTFPSRFDTSMGFFLARNKRFKNNKN